jgi:hypothetical protein
MDNSLLRSDRLQLKNLFESIRRFQKDNQNSKANPEVLKIARGFGLLLIAITLGWIAKSESETAARVQTLHQEWPSIQVLSSILKNGGWEKAKSIDLSLLLKNHPDPFNQSAILWESEDHCFLFLTSNPYEQDHSDPSIWSCATGHKKPNSKIKWIKIGSGYEGVNRLAQIVVQPVKKATSYIDPKEIRY